MKGISLFSSAGIGDLAYRACGIEIVVASELIQERAKLHKRNFPSTDVVVGDIWDKQEEIVSKTLSRIDGDSIDFVFATPPCQGMSRNGLGKLLSGVRAGKKPSIDHRNRLIIPTLNIICELKPKVVFFENVPEMFGTVIDDQDGNLVEIVEYIRQRLGPEYIGHAEVVNFADYGVPQRRQRLITIFSRVAALHELFGTVKTFIPPRSHSASGGGGLKKWTTLRDVISDLPPLDAKVKETAASNLNFHRVPVLDPKKYTWISYTPQNKGAFDNQCVNPACLYQGNQTHGATQNGDGINKFNTDTPLYCEKCNDLLPRPYTVLPDGTLRIMSGFTSAYKRMSWDLPSSTLTTNLSYPSSDHKIHPDQNRVLSLYEAFRLHTLDKFDYVWETEPGIVAKDTLITEVIGESIPPLGIFLLVNHLINCMQEPEMVLANVVNSANGALQLSLPY